MKLATSDYVLHAAEDGLDSLHQLVARHSEPESPVVGPDLLHQAAVHHLAHLLVRRARQVLSGGVVLHAKELVGLREGWQAGSLVAEKGQSYVERGELHNDRSRGGEVLWQARQARDSGLDLAHPDPVDIRDGVKLLWQNVNLFAGLGCSEHRFDQEVIDPFREHFTRGVLGLLLVDGEAKDPDGVAPGLLLPDVGLLLEAEDLLVEGGHILREVIHNGFQPHHFGL